jgi:hypothetical protein
LPPPARPEASLTKSSLAAAVTAQTTALAVAADEAIGLSDAEAARRLAEVGENALLEAHVSLLARLLTYFWGFVTPIGWRSDAGAMWDDFRVGFGHFQGGSGLRLSPTSTGSSTRSISSGFWSLGKSVSFRRAKQPKHDGGSLPA